MGKGILWDGKYYTLPQAGSRIDSSSLTPVSLGNGNKLVLMGDMTGLIPSGTLRKIGGASDGKGLLHPSCEEARLAIDLIFDPAPGSEVQGASELYLLPTNVTTSSELLIAGIPYPGEDPDLFGTYIAQQISLTSFMKGPSANQIRVKMSDGTVSGKKITVVFQDVTETFDNLGKQSFSVTYTGSATENVLSVHVGGSTQYETIWTNAIGAASDNFVLSLVEFPTVQALCDAINSRPNYSATILTNNPQERTADLDSCHSNIKTAPGIYTSNSVDMINQINKRSGYIQAKRIGTFRNPDPPNTDWMYLDGGTSTPGTNDTWQSAFDLLKTTDIQLILPLTSDPSIHAMADSHAGYMSGPKGKSERRVFIGGALQNWESESARATAIDALMAASKALNSDRTVNVGLGCKQYDPNGDVKLYPAYVTAALYAGMAAGGSPTFPLTRKYLRCLGLEVELRVSEIETLLDAPCGVAVPIVDMVQGAGWVISRQLTTWGQDDDLYRLEFSVGRSADYVAKEVRKRHELMIGKPGTPGIDNTIINTTNAVLEACKRDEIIVNFNPRATALRADGTVRYIDYSAVPVLPINWIFSTYHLLPTKFTIGL
jgi:hypothetical protein